MLTDSYAYLGGVLVALLFVVREITGRRRFWQLSFRVALVAWASVVVGLALFPLPVSPHSISVLREGMEAPPAVNLVPLASVLAAVDGSAGPRQPLLIIGNFLAFVPLGLLAPIISESFRRWTTIILLGFGASLAIEVTQWGASLAYGFAWKSFDVDDLLLNTLGTTVGFLAYQRVLRRELGAIRQAS